MKAPWLRWSALVSLIVAALVSWAGVLLMAAHVSSIVLNTLDMIVELAAIT